MNLHIEGRRWFQKTYGNTYHSVRIFVGGQQVAYLPFQYGYGDQFLQTAQEWLNAHLSLLYANGLPETVKRIEYGTRFLREELGGTYSVIDVTRKADL